MPTPGSRLSCAPSVMLNARGASPRLARRPGSRRASRACGGHASQRARRDAKHARLPLSVTAAAVTPSPPGTGAGLRALGRGSPTVAPLRVRVARSALVERGGDLLRRPAEATPAPPAMGPIRINQQSRSVRERDAPCQRVQEHAPAPVACHHDNKRGTREQRPLALRYRVAPRPLRGVTPASTARPPRAVPSRKPQGGPTRAQHDRRCATQSRERGVKPLASRVWALPTSRACVGRRFLLYWYLI